MMPYDPRGTGLFPEPTWWNGDEDDPYRWDYPPIERGPFYCTVCQKNEVDALEGFDTCDECARRMGLK